MSTVPCVLLFVVSTLLQNPPPAGSDCADAAACRQAALDAAAGEDFERFHDLAWRAVQRGKPNDPAAMYLLARAQSLSGRPGDALVMLRRLAEMGVATDAGENPDFRRVRALEGWPAVEELMARAGKRIGEGAPGSPSAARETGEPSRRAAPTDAGARPAPADAAKRATAAGSSTKAAEPGSPATASTPRAGRSRAGVTAAGEETLALSGGGLDAVALAYDAASRRFVIGDRAENRLLVADDVFKHVNTLIGALSAGFGELTAIEIDGRRGDLWVSSSTDGSASVHKLQLVSGRVLSTFRAPDEMQPARFTDLSITDAGTLLILEAEASRLLALENGSGRFAAAVPLGLASPSSLAANDGVAYVAHRDGLAMVDLKTGRVSEIRRTRGVTLEGLRRIRYGRGALLAIQAAPGNGAGRLVRIRLGQTGTLAERVEPLDGEVASDGAALTISRDAAYYVARTDRGPAIRRVPLR